jgi:HEPN domain-containing protein
MNSREMAGDYLQRAERCMIEAENALRERDNPMAVRRSQECIELAIKGILRAAAIEFPREHDVSDVLLDTGWAGMGSPKWFVERVPNLARIMREITPKRGPAMYGFEREMRPAKDIFSVEDGVRAIAEARFVLEAARRFLQEWRG